MQTREDVNWTQDESTGSFKRWKNVVSIASQKKRDNYYSRLLTRSSIPVPFRPWYYSELIPSSSQLRIGNSWINTVSTGICDKYLAEAVFISEAAADIGCVYSSGKQKSFEKSIILQRGERKRRLYLLSAEFQDRKRISTEGGRVIDFQYDPTSDIFTVHNWKWTIPDTLEVRKSLSRRPYGSRWRSPHLVIGWWLYKHSLPLSVQWAIYIHTVGATHMYIVNTD